MVILAAVAGFSVFVLGLYANLNHAQNSAYQGIMSYSQEKPNSISTNSIYIDNSTYLYDICLCKHRIAYSFAFPVYRKRVLGIVVSAPGRKRRIAVDCYVFCYRTCA